MWKPIFNHLILFSEILKKGIENIVYYKEHLVTSAEFTNYGNKVEVYALYNSFALHSSPISINFITNAIAKVLLGDDFSISVANWPLGTPKANFLLVGYSEIKISLLWLVMVPLGCLFTLGSFIIFPHTEINSNFVRLQYMCGVKHYVYWAVNLFVDLLIYLIITLVLSVVICVMSAPFRGVHEFGKYLLTYLSIAILKLTKIGNCVQRVKTKRWPLSTFKHFYKINPKIRRFFQGQGFQTASTCNAFRGSAFHL